MQAGFETPPARGLRKSYFIYHDLILRLWRLYLEVHFQHSEEGIFGKLDLFKERVTENIDDIMLSDGC